MENIVDYSVVGNIFEIQTRVNKISKNCFTNYRSYYLKSKKKREEHKNSAELICYFIRTSNELRAEKAIKLIEETEQYVNDMLENYIAMIELEQIKNELLAMKTLIKVVKHKKSIFN